MWRLTVRDLAFRKRQFALAVLGAMLIFAMALVLTGLSGGFRAEARNTVAAVGADAWVVRAGAMGPFTGAASLPSDAVAQVAAEPGVRAAAPLVVLQLGLRSGAKSERVNVVGYEPGRLGQPPVHTGRVPRHAGEAVADARAGLSIGRTFELSGRPFVVVGRAHGLTAFAGTPNVYAPIDDVRALAFGGRALETAVVTAGIPDRVPGGLAVLTPAVVRADLRSDLAHGIKAIDNLRVFLWVVAALIIGVVMYLSTLERVRDFAVLKAVGWSSGALFSGLVLQGVVVACLGAGFGALVANVLSPLIPLPSVIPGTAFAVLPAVAFVVGVLASLAGLRRAIGVDPAMAFGS